MGKTIPFGPPPPPALPNRPDAHRLAGKLQRLVLERPYEGRIIEEWVDRLLAKIDTEE